MLLCSARQFGSSIYVLQDSVPCRAYHSEVVDKMLQVRMLSGEMVTSIPVEEIHDVKSLKLRLNQLHGLPPRFRQRLLLSGVPLEDII